MNRSDFQFNEDRYVVFGAPLRFSPPREVSPTYGRSHPPESPQPSAASSAPAPTTSGPRVPVPAPPPRRAAPSPSPACESRPLPRDAFQSPERRRPAGLLSSWRSLVHPRGRVSKVSAPARPETQGDAGPWASRFRAGGRGGVVEGVLGVGARTPRGWPRRAAPRPTPIPRQEDAPVAEDARPAARAAEEEGGGRGPRPARVRGTRTGGRGLHPPALRPAPLRAPPSAARTRDPKTRHATPGPRGIEGSVVGGDLARRHVQGTREWDGVCGRWGAKGSVADAYSARAPPDAPARRPHESPNLS